MSAERGREILMQCDPEQWLRLRVVFENSIWRECLALDQHGTVVGRFSARDVSIEASGNGLGVAKLTLPAAVCQIEHRDPPPPSEAEMRKLREEFTRPLGRLGRLP